MKTIAQIIYHFIRLSVGSKFKYSIGQLVLSAMSMVFIEYPDTPEKMINAWGKFSNKMLLSGLKCLSCVESEKENDDESMGSG